MRVWLACDESRLVAATETTTIGLRMALAAALAFVLAYILATADLA